MKNIKSLLTYEYNDWGSHQPALILGVKNTKGDVLELGTGDSSTLLLNELLKNTNRKILSIDDNDEWMKKYKNLENTNHEFKLVNHTFADWKVIIDECKNKKWGVTFVDQSCCDLFREVRTYAFKQLINCSDFVVMHDADLFPEIENEDCTVIKYIPHKRPIPCRQGPSSYILSKNFDFLNFNF